MMADKGRLLVKISPPSFLAEILLSGDDVRTGPDEIHEVERQYTDGEGNLIYVLAEGWEVKAAYWETVGA